VDVTLNKITDVVREEVKKFRETPEAHQVTYRIEERDKWSVAGVTSLRDEEVRTQILHGGRLASTYAMVEMGKLAHDSEVIYTALSFGKSNSEKLDNDLLEKLKEATRMELDCHVCYALVLDPVTTACGHTYCRKCVHRILDHSKSCPICRRTLLIPPIPNPQQAPSNIVLTKLLKGLCPEALAEREQIAKEELAASGDLNTPLFICTLSFPNMPTFLHIFEPRYRLMMRRVTETADRNFGMLLPNSTRERQGDLGKVPFYQYGTLLHIQNMQQLHDGRSILECTGVSRFKVVSHGMLDGYTVGKIERVDDISIAAEEALEAAETSSALHPRNLSAQDHFGAPPYHSSPESSRESTPIQELGTISRQDLNAKSTRELMSICFEFVLKMKEQSEPWLTDRVILAYGEPPDDPALFPWWFASVLPLDQVVKYKVLGTSSVRERLKICVELMIQFEILKSYVKSSTLGKEEANSNSGPDRPTNCTIL
jgi:hypothetical protein